MTTWTVKAKQVETWAAESQPVRVFDPAVFDNAPIFDTGSTAFWTEKPHETELWTAV